MLGLSSPCATAEAMATRGWRGNEGEANGFYLAGRLYWL